MDISYKHVIFYRNRQIQNKHFKITNIYSTSRYLNRSNSTHSLLQDEDGAANSDYLATLNSSGRSRYLAMKDRRNRLARSRSSHILANDDGDEFEDPVLATALPSTHMISRCDLSSFN